MSLLYQIRIPAPVRRNTARFLGTRPGREKSDPQPDDQENGKNYQLLHESIVPTDKFQSSLPRMPIPKLDETCRKYLLSQEPLLPEEEFIETAKLVEEFRTGPGLALDKALRRLDRQNKHTSYINGPWNEMYLKDRRPLVINFNPGIMLADDTRAEMMNNAMRATNMLVSSLRFHKSFKTKVLQPEVFHLQPAKTNNSGYWNKVKYMPGLIATPLSYLFKAFPLDMSQYGNLLFSTRIPGLEKDYIQSFPDADHMMVMRKGHIYSFKVYDSQGNIFPPGYYLKCFQQILQDRPKSAPSNIGALTTEKRDTWAELRSHIRGLSARNEEALATIDSAMYTICLDEHWEHGGVETEMDSVRNLVMGHDPSNRWFDKSFSLIYSTNGTCGINFEHAWGDGVAVMRFVDEVVRDSQSSDFAHQKSGRDLEARVNRHDFDLDDKAKAAIESARKSYMDKMATVEYNPFIMHGFGKKECKRASVGPDSLMQTGFQIAYHRLHGRFVPTYESCSTAIYRHGRTETVRPLTKETKRCAEIFNSVSSSSGDKMLALKESSTRHMDLIKMAAQGQGWDRHLFALKALALPENLPKLFRDPAYARINENVISTSTLSSRNMVNGGFVAVVPNGHGIGYQIQDDMLGTCISNFNTHTNGSDFNEAVKETFQDIQRVFLETNGSNQ